ncbi:MAG TPA: VWA domain-containing protein [Jiangellaceae bacterium]
MVLINAWIVPVWAVAVVLGAAILLRRRRRTRNRSEETRLPLANTARLSSSPRFVALMRRYRLLLGITLACVVMLTLSAVALSARVASTATEIPDRLNRDIMLCLDVSGSMTATDAELLGIFAELAGELDGERIGLTYFGGAAVNVFPLTDDYPFIEELLDEHATRMVEGDLAVAAGTYSDAGTSLIGDGLASCVTRFDRLDSDRPRSIVLATDSMVSGGQIITLDEAGRLAEENDVHVYGINPNDFGGAESDSFRAMVERTGGTYHVSDDPSGVDRIVASITAEEAERLEGAPELVVTDRPGVPVAFATIAVVALIGIGWRLDR